jgi:2,4-dichlorophenol 6-monooxygenase
MEGLKTNSPTAAEQREKLRAAIASKSYEFNAHGVEMNQRYQSNAVVPDGTPEPEWRRDRELYYQATTWPGARLPHVWLERDGKQVSTLDVAGHGRFTLLTGIGGEAWVEAAKTVSARTGVTIEAHVIGPGRELRDVFGDWAVVREIDEAGCVLVRPDHHVAFRSMTASTTATATLAAAMASLLGTAS